jgi:hypothetical protein
MLNMIPWSELPIAALYLIKDGSIKSAEKAVYLCLSSFYGYADSQLFCRRAGSTPARMKEASIA